MDAVSFARVFLAGVIVGIGFTLLACQVYYRRSAS